MSVYYQFQFQSFSGIVSGRKVEFYCYPEAANRIQITSNDLFSNRFVPSVSSKTDCLNIPVMLTSKEGKLELNLD